MKDAKGKSIPAWARYIKPIASSLAAQKDAQNIPVPFALHCSDDATVELVPIDNKGVSVTMTLGAGYHPIACESVTSTTIAIHALFAWNFEA